MSFHAKQVKVIKDSLRSKVAKEEVEKLKDLERLVARFSTGIYKKVVAFENHMIQ